MIKKLEVENFKSIKHLKLDCKKVNIFIGKPNTGKSNILESIGVFSLPYGSLKDFVRFEDMTNLFYDGNTEEKIEISIDDLYCEIRFVDTHFEGNIGEKKEIAPLRKLIIDGSKEDKRGKTFNFDFNYDYKGGGSSGTSGVSPFKFYRFEIINLFPKKEFTFLLPPKGENLLQLLITKKTIRKTVADIFSEFGLKVVLEPQENKIKVRKEIEDIEIFYPYSLVSDTLQRTIFHLVAMETNKDSIIIFEEPEAHAFPYYTKFLAERIALDKTNQYFISTHNPYFLQSILEKTPEENIKIFITYLKEYQTKVKGLNNKEKEKIMNLGKSAFYNFAQFIEEE